MTDRERIMRILNANYETQKKIDDILMGRDKPIRHLDQETRLLTMSEAAKMLNISRPSVYRMLESGRLSYVTIAGVRRVTLRSVLELSLGIREDVPEKNSATKTGAGPSGGASCQLPPRGMRAVRKSLMR